MKNLFKENEKVIIKKELSLIDEKLLFYSQSVGVPGEMEALEGFVFTIKRVINEHKYFLYTLKEDKQRFVFHEKMLSKYIDNNNNYLFQF